MRAYRNLNIAKRLFLSLMMVAVLGAVIGMLGINEMSHLSEANREMYEYNTLPIRYLGAMYDTLASQRICNSNMVVFRNTNPQFAKAEAASLVQKEALFDDAFNAFAQALPSDEEKRLYEMIYQLYYNDFKELKANVKKAIALGDEKAISDAIYAMDAMGAEISGYMDEAFVLNNSLAFEKVQANAARYRFGTAMLITAMAVGALLAVCFAALLGRKIVRPLGRIKNATRQVAQTGSLNFSEDAIRAIRQDARFTDEIGQVASAFAAMMDALIEKTKILETVASGDLTPAVALASENDTIGNAIALMLDNLNEMFAEINKISQQVATGSAEIAIGSQTLARGTAEQAATIETISAAVAQIVSLSDVCAQTAIKATGTGESICAIALKGNEKMRNMMNAVQEINDASKSIGKVIQSVDGIALQTNLLALNAAVEAARAGQHGIGFAVVADEVRNLAAKSAEAASETATLITANIDKAELGLSFSKDTTQSLKLIVEGIQGSTALLQTMADQTTHIREVTLRVNSAIDQVAQVIRQNSATGKQSAAASEEMSMQSQTLKNMVARFRLKETEQEAPSGN